MGAITFSLDETLLDFFVKALDIEVFVETGTFEGESLALASRKVGECHSVELSREYFDVAARRFAGQANVQLAQGDSATFLRERQSRFTDRRVLYWLDAHWCVAEHAAGEDSQSPLLREIEALGRLADSSVVCIDDARLYLCPPPDPHRYTDWPDFHDLLTSLLGCGPEHRIMVLNDVILLYPGSVDRTLKRFAFDRGADWLNLANLAWRQPATDKTRRKGWRRIIGRVGRAMRMEP